METGSALRKLFSLHRFGIKLGLENTLTFLKYLGNPQHKLRTIHIAGSNGKGSTASFTASILQELGFRTGLYTSPHFVQFNERIQINGIKVSDEYIANFITEHENFIDKNELTFFEVTTALAFKYFFENETDCCVVETGLGGRLDSTNVLNPLAVAITTISLEHTNVLGENITEIASEKAAIIKPGSKVFTGLLKPEAEEVISEICTQTGCELFRLNDFIQGELNLKLKSGRFLIDLGQTPLKGRYQQLNSGLAALLVSKTFEVKETGKLLEGIKNVFKNTGIQGRYEYFHENPTIIFDSAHNPEGVNNFIQEFRREAGNYGKKVLLFGAMRDKAIAEMLSALKPYFDEIVLTEIDYERSAKTEELGEICNRYCINAVATKNPADFVRIFQNRAENECLVVLGSMYLLGEVKNKLLVGVT